MNNKPFLTLFFMTVPLAIGQTVRADTNSVESNGLYYISSNETAQTIKMADGSTVRLGEKAEIQILKARVFPENDENTDFEVRLNTSDYPADPKTGDVMEPFVLRIGDHGYSWGGGGGQTGHYNEMMFNIHNQDEAKAAAKWLAVDCKFRTPPGYKFLAQFIPTRSEFHADEPVLVKFVMKNLDDKTIVFQSGGQQRGNRDNQYGFRAFYQYTMPMPDVGNPVNFGGLCQLINLEPGKEFEGNPVDLKKWFKFDKAGRYSVHGCYRLDFYPPGKISEVFQPWNVIWSDYASADFTVVVK